MARHASRHPQMGSWGTSSDELYSSPWVSEYKSLDQREGRLTSSELHQKLMLRQNQTKQVHLPEVYIMPDASKRNVNRWMSAHRIEDVKDDIEKVCLTSSSSRKSPGWCAFRCRLFARKTLQTDWTAYMPRKSSTS